MKTMSSQFPLSLIVRPKADNPFCHSQLLLSDLLAFKLAKPIVSKGEERSKLPVVLILQGADPELLFELVQFLDGRCQVEMQEAGKGDLQSAQPVSQNGSSLAAQADKAPSAMAASILFPKYDWLQKVNECIEKHLDDVGFRAADLAGCLCICEMQLHRKLKKYADLSPANYIRKYRLHRGQTLLADLSLSITEVSLELGFNYLEYFSRSFKKEFGVSPMAFRNGLH